MPGITQKTPRRGLVRLGATLGGGGGVPGKAGRLWVSLRGCDGTALGGRGALLGGRRVFVAHTRGGRALRACVVVDGDDGLGRGGGTSFDALGAVAHLKCSRGRQDKSAAWCGAELWSR